MSDITDAGPRLRSMNDALEENDRLRAEIARLTALTESLRREVREQRREIAGLREERRAVLDADRPPMDRRLAALEQLVALDEELDLPRTPAPPSTPAECSVPPEWTSRPYWVDPPSGHRYGFPRLYDPASDGDMTEWLVVNGYPERLARQGLACTFTAYTDDGEK